MFHYRLDDAALLAVTQKSRVTPVTRFSESLEVPDSDGRVYLRHNGDEKYLTTISNHENGAEEIKKTFPGVWKRFLFSSLMMMLANNINVIKPTHCTLLLQREMNPLTLTLVSNNVWAARFCFSP